MTCFSLYLLNCLQKFVLPLLNNFQYNKLWISIWHSVQLFYKYFLFIKFGCLLYKPTSNTLRTYFSKNAWKMCDNITYIYFRNSLTLIITIKRRDWFFFLLCNYISYLFWQQRKKRKSNILSLRMIILFELSNHAHFYLFYYTCALFCFFFVILICGYINMNEIFILDVIRLLFAWSWNGCKITKKMLFILCYCIVPHIC